jgi:signal transduction histidine kinase
MTARRRGLAFLCDSSGRIRRVLRDDYQQISDESGALHDLLDPLSREKADRFLETILRNGSASGWELNVVTGNRIRPFQFAGVSDADGLFVAGADQREGIEHLLDELMEEGGDQPGGLRAALRERQDLDDRRSARDHDLYDDLSRLNNELSNAQRELASRGAELARLNEEKNRFVGMAAHDLRSPLSVIYTYAGLLQSDSSDRLTSVEKESLSEIRVAADYMLRIVNDMLDVAKIEAGQLDVVREDVGIRAFLERVLRYCRPGAERKRIGLALDIDDRLQQICTDPAKLHQVIVNLVNNAVRYSDEGTTVRIRARVAEPSISIEVADEGPGMAPEEIARIFRPFERLQRTDGRGSGLGLVIVKRLVELLGGSVRVESEVGAGSTFRVELPLLREQ